MKNKSIQILVILIILILLLNLLLLINYQEKTPERTELRVYDDLDISSYLNSSYSSESIILDPTVVKHYSRRNDDCDDCDDKEIECSSDSDCGENSFLNNRICNEGNVFDDYKEYLCNNPGTTCSSCESTTTNILVESCSFACSNGSCYEECAEDDDCGNESYSENYCIGAQVWKNHTIPGCSNESCSFNELVEFVENCTYACSNGSCYGACVEDDDCEDDYTTNYCEGNDVYSEVHDFGCEDSSCSENVSNVYVESCVGLCVNGSCEDPVITCSKNSDCGLDWLLGAPYCGGEDVFLDSIHYTCNNPGEITSYCSNYTNSSVTDCGEDSCGIWGENHCIGDDVYHERNCQSKGCSNGGCFSTISLDDELVKECADLCVDGECVEELFHDVALIDFSNSVNGIFLEYANGTDILDEIPILNCGEIIKVKVRAENQGDYNEDVILNGQLEGIVFLLNPINNMDPEDVNYRSSLSPYVSLNLTQGIYNISVEAIVPVDNDLTDNIAVREIQVICEEPECEEDIDCGNEDYSENYCISNGVYRNHTIPQCVGGSCEEEFIIEFIENCTGECIDGSCEGPVITCSKNSDCGLDWLLGAPYCGGGDVFLDSIHYVCENPGTTASYCTNYTNSSITDCGEDSCGSWEEDYCVGDAVYHNRTCHNSGCSEGSCFCNDYFDDELIKNCTFGCSNGNCLDECSLDLDCGNEDYSENYCISNEVYRNHTIPQCIGGSCEEEFIIEFIENCTGECIDGSCENPVITCSQNTDCGFDWLLGAPYCSNDNSLLDSIHYECVNAGTIASYCTNWTNTSVDDCGESSCDNWGANHCVGDNIYRSRTCYNNGCSDGGCFSEVNTDNDYITNCNYGCSSGVCLNPPITCQTKEDCGATGYVGSGYCQDDDVFKSFQSYFCSYPGTINSKCGNSIAPKKLKECGEDYCTEFSIDYCKDNDVYHKQTCYDKGCVLGDCFNNPSKNEVIVNDCEYGCYNGECTIPEITCSENSECGTDGYVNDDYCFNDGVYRDYETFECLLAGTPDSSCSSNTETILQETCDDICVDGVCEEIECYTDDDCEDSDEFTIDSCINPGTSESRCENDYQVCEDKKIDWYDTIYLGSKVKFYKGDKWHVNESFIKENVKVYEPIKDYTFTMHSHIEMEYDGYIIFKNYMRDGGFVIIDPVAGDNILIQAIDGAFYCPGGNDAACIYSREQNLLYNYIVASHGATWYNKVLDHSKYLGECVAENIKNVRTEDWKACGLAETRVELKAGDVVYFKGEDGNELAGSGLEVWEYLPCEN